MNDTSFHTIHGVAPVPMSALMDAIEVLFGWRHPFPVGGKFAARSDMYAAGIRP